MKEKLRLLKVLPGFQIVEKVDSEGKVTHSVLGIATSDIRDKDNEIAEYEGTLEQIKLWSNDAVSKTTGNGQELSLGNIRVQHDPKQIGGKVTAIEPNKSQKQITINTQPLDKIFDELIKPGMVKGFSIAGSYKSRVCNECDHDIERGHYCVNCKKDVVTRYVPIISEISYVDNPCNPDCSFTYVKADGAIEVRKFEHPTSKISPVQDAEVSECKCSCVNCMAGDHKECTMPGCDCSGKAASADEKGVVKTVVATLVSLGVIKEAKTKRVAGEDLPASSFAYVGDKDDTSTWKLPYKGFSTDAKNKSHVRKALARFNQTQGIPSGEKAKVKAKLVAAAKKHGIEVSDDSKKAVRAAMVKVFGEDLVVHAEEVFKLDAEIQLFKGMYTVGSLASLMDSLQWLVASTEYERDYEGDDSDVPDDLRGILEDLVPIFVAMAQEEASELLAQSKKAANGGQEGGKSMKETDADLLKAAKEKLAELWKKAKSIFHKMAKSYDGCAKAFHKAAEHHEALADHHIAAGEAGADKAVAAELQKLNDGAEFKKMAKVDQIIAKAEVLEKAKGMAGHFGKMAKAHGNVAKCMTKAAGHHEDLDKAAVAVGNAEDSIDMGDKEHDSKEAEPSGSSEKAAAEKAEELKKAQDDAEKAAKEAAEKGGNEALLKAIQAGNAALEAKLSAGIEAVKTEVAAIKKDVDEFGKQLDEGPAAKAARLAQEKKHNKTGNEAGAGDGKKSILSMPAAQKSTGAFRDLA